MKKLVVLVGCLLSSFWALAWPPKTWTDSNTGIIWTYTEIVNGVEIGSGSIPGAVPKSTVGAISIPSYLPGGAVLRIASGAFADCSGLTAVTIPFETQSIFECAFFGCSALTSITIPERVIYIDKRVFPRCSSLTNIQVSSYNTSYTSVDGVLFTRDMSTIVSYPGGRSGDYAIPSVVTNIWAGAFESCQKLTGVTIPPTVTTISACAFLGCNGLAKITIPSSVTKIIGGNAFRDCDAMSFDFEGAPPKYDSWMGIKEDASIRYNVAYEAEWLPVIKNLGWTNATPYTPEEKPKPEGGPYTEIVDGVEWTFMVSAGLTACVGKGMSSGQAIPTSTTGAIIIPATLGGRSVTDIGDYAFYSCSGITSVEIPLGVTSIGEQAFRNCSLMTSVIMPNGVVTIEDRAFYNCNKLSDLTITSSVTNIGSYAFYACGNLESIYFDGDAPEAGTDVFKGTPSTMAIHVKKASDGWIRWNDRKVFQDESGGSDTPAAEVTRAELTITNVMVCYIMNSVQPDRVIPASMDAGYVNILTEVKSGGVVSVPATWMVNYPNYVAKFGADFTQSLMKPTGKRDGMGNPMTVWQDYVAGTDPTDENDVFTASITTDTNGKLIISYTPELSDEEKAKRVYKTLGKVKLQDKDWVEVPAGHEDDYNFFKVTVEMK